MKKLLASILLMMSSTCFAEQVKTIYSPFTGRQDFITALSTQSIGAGTGITVTTTSAGVIITGTGGGGGFISTSTAYIQNTLAPNTTSQQFSVALSSAFNSIVNSTFTLEDPNTDNWTAWHYTGLSGGFTKSRIFAHTRGGAGDLFSIYASTATSDSGSAISGDSEIRIGAGTSPVFRFTLWGDGFTVPDYSVDLFRDNFSVTNHMSLNSINGVNPSTFSFYDGDNSNYIGLRASDTISNNNTYVLPASSGTSGQALLTDGSNNLYFGSVSSAGDNLGNHIATKTITASYGMTVSTILVSSYIEAPFTARDTLIQATVVSVSTTINTVGFSGYFMGDTVVYRFYAYRTYNGTKIYSYNYYDTGTITIPNDGDTVTLDWGHATGASGYIIIQNYNGIGFDDYYADVGYVDTITDDNNFDSFFWTFGSPPITPAYIDFLYGHRSSSSAFSVYGQAGYFDGSSVIGSIPTSDNLNYGLSVYNTATSTVALYVEDTDSAYNYGAVFKGYSDGGFATKNVLAVQNELGQVMADFGGSNLAGAGDYGSVNLRGKATSAQNLYSLGDVTWVNDSTESSGDKRVGTFRVYRDGAWNQSSLMVLVRNTGGFQYALVSTYDNKTGISGISAPSARLHLPAGSATAGTAPIKLTVGPYTTSAVAGQIEWSNSFPQALTFSPAASERYRLTMTDSGVVTLTSGRVPFATTNGRLTDDSDMTFATDTLTVSKISVSTITASSSTVTNERITGTLTGNIITASSISVSGQLDAGTSTIRGKLTVWGVLDPIALVLSTNTAFPGTNVYIESSDGSGASTATLNTGRLRYNNSGRSWQYSVSTAAYVNFSSATALSGTQYKIPTWGTTTALIDSAITVDSGNKTLTYAPAATTSAGSPVLFRITNPGHSSQGGGGSTIIDLDLISATDINVTGGGNVFRDYSARFTPHTFASGGFGTTVSTAATVSITGAPTSSTAGTLSILNSYSFWVQAGSSRFDSALIVGSGNDATFNGNATVNGATSLSTTTVYSVNISTKVGNPIMGSVTLVGGTATVSTGRVTAASIIMLADQDGTSNLGSLSVSARTAGTSFTITSTNPLNTSKVGWLILEPAP